MFKKVIVWLLVIIATVSLLTNYHQYHQIRDFRSKQYNIDNELKSQTQTLINCLEDIDKLDKAALEEQMKLTYMTLNFSAYKQNQTVSDAFYKLQVLIYSEDDLSTYEASEISSLLKQIIKPEKYMVDIEACKELDNYIVSISTM